MGLLGGAMDMLGFGNKEASDGGQKKKGLFDSLKFWENEKDQETNQVTSEIKGELNGMYSNLMLVAKGLNIDTDIDAAGFADGMNKEDDSWYKFGDSSESDVKKVLGDIVTKIQSDPKLAIKYADLVSNIGDMNKGNIIDQLLGGLGKIPGVTGLISKLVKPFLGWASQFKRVQENFKLDINQVIADVTKDLGLLAQELSGNISSNEEKLSFNPEDDFDEGRHETVNPNDILGTDVSLKAKQFVDYAETYQDEKYVWGGNGKKGVDCSGLIQQCMLKGKLLGFPRTAADQMKYSRLSDRSIENAMLGDLIFFENIAKSPKGKISHVGIIKGRLANGDLVVYDASRNANKVSTRIMPNKSKKYNYHIKDSSKLVSLLDVSELSYNSHTSKSADGMIKVA